jgi:hypothetical protein
VKRRCDLAEGVYLEQEYSWTAPEPSCGLSGGWDPEGFPRLYVNGEEVEMSEVLSSQLDKEGPIFEALAPDFSVWELREEKDYFDE